MSREMRRVPADWQHPQVTKFSFGSPSLSRTSFVPLLSYETFLNRRRHLKEAMAGQANNPNFNLVEIIQNIMGEGAMFMPDFGDKATHYMMYETCSEGTPISPAFATPEELARWLTDNRACAFGDMTATYEQWLRTAKGNGECVGLTMDLESGASEPAFT